MATNTPNYNLVKPELNDFADIRVLNGNMDIIDAQLKKASDIDLSNYATKPELKNYLPLTGGNLTGNLTVSHNQVLYTTKSITDENGNYYYEMSDGSVITGGVFTDLNQGGKSGGTNAIDTYAKRVNYLQPINKTLIGFTTMLLPDNDSSFWGNSSACAMLRQPDTTGFYIECRSSYNSMLTNTSKCMWRAYFK